LLVIEDDPRGGKSRAAAAHEGDEAEDARAACAWLLYVPTLVPLDLGLPKLDGRGGDAADPDPADADPRPVGVARSGEVEAPTRARTTT
jgi:hypothetical protein